MDFKESQMALAHEEMIVPPAKIVEERGRGTEIHSVADQGKLLQYWPWSQQPIEVGILVPVVNYTIEYWMTITLQPEPGDEDPLIYHRVLKEIWIQRLRGISQGVAQSLETLEDDFGVKMRYLFNSLRVWFAPNGSIQAGLNRPMAEESTPKDKWYSCTDIMAFSIPPMPNERVEESPTILFGLGSRLQIRYDDPEVQGGKIALVAT
jgi:hypothetical protein